jgi:ATP-dependent DNA helicase RecG
VVYPRLEEGDAENGIKAVLDEYQKLGRELSPWKVGMVHGRMPVEEREQIMQQFQRNEVQALLATSVIEVGVDVANATVMLVENAECFGLAQLHQLRGRIGRGSHDSFCILLANLKTQEAVSRLRILTETVDGFRIAEADLALRGPGELCGQDQSGLPQFRFGDLARDLRLVERAREMAGRYLDVVKQEGREVLNSENRMPKSE